MQNKSGVNHCDLLDPSAISADQMKFELIEWLQNNIIVFHSFNSDAKMLGIDLKWLSDLICKKVELKNLNGEKAL